MWIIPKWIETELTKWIKNRVETSTSPDMDWFMDMGREVELWRHSFILTPGTSWWWWQERWRLSVSQSSSLFAVLEMVVSFMILSTDIRVSLGYTNICCPARLLSAQISKFSSQSLNSETKGTELKLLSKCTTTIHPPPITFKAGRMIIFLTAGDHVKTISLRAWL